MILAKNKGFVFRDKDAIITDLIQSLKPVGSSGDGLNRYFTCPFCGKGRQGETTFVLQIETGVYKCFRDNCQNKGNFITLAKYMGIKTTQPEGDNPTNNKPSQAPTQTKSPVIIPEIEIDWSLYEEIKFNPAKVIQSVQEYKFINELGIHVQSENRKESLIGSKRIWQSYISNNTITTAKPKDFEPCLYESQRVIMAQTIFFCEGPKKAKLINDIIDSENIGQYIVATSCAGGSKNYKSDFNKFFNDNQVVIFLSDNDSAAKKLYSDISRNLTGKVKKLYTPKIPKFKIMKNQKYKFTDIADLIEFNSWGWSEIETNLLPSSSNDISQPDLITDDDDGQDDSDGEASDNLKDKVEFWEYVTNDDKTAFRVDIVKFLVFLEENGFTWFYENDKSELQFIQIIDNLIHYSSELNIKEFVLKWIEREIKEQPLLDDMKNEFLKPTCRLFSLNYLNALHSVNLELNKDTKDKSFVYYRNCYVEIEKDSVVCKQYSQLDGLIWADNILKRDYKHNDLGYEGIFYKFSKNINGGSEEKLISYMTALGYLCHRYKDPANAKAVLISDKNFSENPDGRTGKSLTGIALGHIRNLMYENGKDFNPDNQFKYQKINYETEIFQIDDIKKQFDFSSFFSTITGDWTVEKKGKQSFNISFEDSPKVFIPCNYMPKLQGSSSLARAFRHYIENYYSIKYSPEDEFGKKLFTEFDDKDWTEFDNFMIQSIKLYIGSGLLESTDVNTDITDAKHKYSEIFIDYLDTLLNDLTNDFSINPKEVRLNYIEYSGDHEKLWSQKRVTSGIMEYFSKLNINTEIKNVRNGSKIERCIIGNKPSLIKSGKEAKVQPADIKIQPINDLQIFGSNESENGMNIY